MDNISSSRKIESLSIELKKILSLVKEEVRCCWHVESNLQLALPQRRHGHIQIGQAVQIEMVQARSVKVDIDLGATEDGEVVSSLMIIINIVF